MQVNIEVSNLPGVQAKLEEAGKKISNTKPLMLELGNHLENISRDSFDNHKDPYGNSWNPLAASTKKYKKTSKMLYDEGDLQNNFINTSTKDTVAVGTNANYQGFLYPIVQQFGTEDGKVPARAFMPIKEDMSLYDNVEDELQDIVIEFINSAI